MDMSFLIITTKRASPTSTDAYNANAVPVLTQQQK